MSSSSVRALSGALVLCLFAAPSFQAAQSAVPTPSEFLEMTIGGDGVLADWTQIVEYYRHVDPLSDRIVVQEIGRTTEDRPYLLAIVTSPENHRRLDELRAINDRLADPRRTTPEEASALAADGKTIVAIQLGIHSTEVAATQVGMELLHRFATENTARMQAVLENCIILLSPSHNPDGTQMVAEWVRRTNGTPFEGAPLPRLYQKYVGHDNNRDWYFFTQKESQLSVERIWNVWKPQISYDMHQMGPTAARIFVPPYVDPYDPHIDPILRSSINALGTSMAWRLLAEGKDGVVVHAMYDMWTPARGYVNYHGGIRMLTEVASARLASPLTLRFEDLGTGIGYDAKKVSWNFPRPWRGGVWRLRDIMDYEHIAADALLDHAARHRREWLENFYRVNQNAVGPLQPETGARKPYAIVIPAEQADPMAADRLLGVLHMADVEIHRARGSFSAGGREYPAGSHVVLLAQPASNFALTMTDVQRYPDIRQYPGGPPQQPYDVTAHTLQLLMGVELQRVAETFEADLELLSTLAPRPGRVIGDRTSGAYILGHGTGDLLALNRLLARGLRAFWAMDAITAGDAALSPGAIVLPTDGQPALHDAVAELAVRTGITVRASAPPANVRLAPVHAPRIGLYQPWVANMDEGWTRWVLEQFEFPYSTLHDGDIRSGSLGERFDVIVLADQGGRSILQGHAPGSMPPEFVGGIAGEGRAALRAFVESGGTLVTLDSSSLFAIELFDLPVRNALAGLSGGDGREERSADFYAPGSIVRTRVDVRHPVGFGSPSDSIAWFEQSPAFEVTGGEAKTVVSYPATGDPLLSGWLLGGDKLLGRSAVVEAPVGKGKVILFGFRPQYRAQTWATFKLFFNALFAATLGDLGGAAHP